MWAGSGVMMTMSGLTSVSWHHVTNVTWHQCRTRDMCHGLSPVTKLSISSIQMSLLSPAPHASMSAPVARRERGEWDWNHLKWSILHYRIRLTLKTTIYNAPTEHGWIKSELDVRSNVYISGMNESMKNEIKSKGFRCDDIHEIGDDCEHINTVPDLRYDHVCPWSSGHLSPPPLMSHCQPRTYLHILKCYPRHWTHETSNQCHQCQCNNNNIQKGEMDPPPSDCHDCVRDSDKFQGTSWTKEDGYWPRLSAWAGPELSLRLRSATKRDSQCVTIAEILRRGGALIDTALSPRTEPGSPQDQWVDTTPAPITSASPPVAIAHSNKYKNIKD